MTNESSPSATDRWEDGLLAADLQCPICMEFLCEPLLLGCGHSFCRLCLLKSTQLAPDGRRCPECRAQIELKNPVQHPVDTVLDSKIRIVVPPDVLAKRMEAHRVELEDFVERVRHNLPIFFMRGIASKPGEVVALHLFEPRYQILIRRTWECNRRFICTQSSPREGDTGLVVEVEEAKFLADGRANIQGRGVQTVTLKRVWVEDGTGGLFYAEISEVLRTFSRSNSAFLQLGTDSRVSSSSSIAQAQARIREAIRQGAPTYNRGDYKGCFDLYHRVGTRLLEDLSDNESRAAALIHRGLKEADAASRRGDWSAAAWAMRHAFDDALEIRSSERNSHNSSNSDVQARLLNSAEEIELPIFVLRPGVNIQQRVQLRLFEPRYRTLAQETSRSSKKLFIYAGSEPSSGSEASLVLVDDCNWDSSGNVTVRGICISTISLLSVRVDSDKGGLIYGRCVISGSGARNAGRTAGRSDVAPKPNCCVVQ